MPKGFRGVSIPKDLLDEVERLIKENPHYGYRTIADFIVDAIRWKIQQMGLRLPTWSIIEKTENEIILWDGREGTFVKVMRTPDGLRCTYCDSRRCDHVRYAESIESYKR